MEETSHQHYRYTRSRGFYLGGGTRFAGNGRNSDDFGRLRRSAGTETRVPHLINYQFKAQTLTVWRQASKFNLPSVFYVNKMDKPNANFERSVESIESRLCHSGFEIDRLFFIIQFFV